MIDIENQVIDTVIKALRGRYDPIFAYGEAVDVPAGYPCVTVIERNNSVSARHIDSGGIENAVELMYEVNVYSNLSQGKKQQAKEIRSFVNEIMADMGFVRTLSQPVENLGDTSIYRIISRYEAKADNDHIYRK